MTWLTDGELEERLRQLGASGPPHEFRERLHEMIATPSTSRRWRRPRINHRRLAGAAVLSVAAVAGIVAAIDGLRTPAARVPTDSSVGFPVSRVAWQPGVYLPAARSDAAVAALGGRVFVLGGIAHGGHSGERATVFVQGDGVPAWHRATDMPQPRAGGAAVAAGGRLYVVGGLLFPIGGRLLPQPMLVYSPSSNSWMSVEVPGPARAQPAVAEASFHGHPTLFIFGGETATGGVAPSLSYDTVTGAFFRLPAPPVPMLDTTAASVGGVVYLFGSATLEGYERPTVVAYRPERRTYTMRTPIPHPIAGVTWMSGTSAVIDGRVWIVADDPAGRRVDVYDPATNSWMRARDLTLPQRGGSAVAVGRTLSVIGGTKPIDNGNAVGEIRTVQVLHARD